MVSHFYSHGFFNGLFYYKPVRSRNAQLRLYALLGFSQLAFDRHIRSLFGAAMNLASHEDQEAALSCYGISKIFVIHLLCLCSCHR